VTFRPILKQRRQQQIEAAKLDATITANIEELGYGG
jgi:hypothetical protein